MMRRTMQKVVLLLLAMATAVSALTGSAFAKSDKSKSGKSDKEAVSTVGGDFSAITLAQAEEIALSHAGVESAEVVFTKEKLDKAVYEVKFYVPTAKYEYEISAIDGTILRSEAEVKEPHYIPDLSAQSPSLDAAVSPEQARQIALNAAGLSADALKHITCYVSWVDHAPYAYEVKFSACTGYYHYTIDLNSGAVLGSCSSFHR